MVEWLEGRLPQEASLLRRKGALDQGDYGAYLVPDLPSEQLHPVLLDHASSYSPHYCLLC